MYIALKCRLYPQAACYAYKVSNILSQGGSPGLVVMGGDSRTKGRGFESQHQILDGHYIFHIDLL